MKKIIATLLCAGMILCGCAKPQPQSANEGDILSETAEPVSIDSSNYEFSSLGDEDLLTYVENVVYQNTVEAVDSEDYFVENVSTVYVSKEYLDEVAFNSESSIYFGYTLSELNEVFQDSKYIFTVGEDGKTTVQELQEIEDKTFETVVKNVAIGTAVILVCVTVSSVSVAGAPAVSLIFAASAKTAQTFAVSSALFGGLSAGIVRGIQTGDVNEAIDAAVLVGSEGFKWGAISGAITGGVGKAKNLYGAAKQTNFTMNQYAKIQQETGYPLDVIKELHTMKEYEAFRNANLKATMVGNKSALIKTDIDFWQVDKYGRTNLERMRKGLAPLDPDGISYEIHHVGQRKDGTLAILRRGEHDNPSLHGFLERTEAHAEGTHWDAERQQFWKTFAEMVG